MSYRVTRVDPKLHNTHIEAKCIVCSTVTQMIVPTVHFQKWLDGAHIQESLITLSPGNRELLITSICGTCFDDVTEEDDDELNLDDISDIDLPDFGIPYDDFPGDSDNASK